jgi:preprotein translocase subunit SecE
MSTKKDPTETYKLDIIKWIIVLTLLSGSILGFYIFTEQSLLLRVISLLAVIGIATFIASTTQKGHRTKSFLHETHLEVRRVVWPTRKETLHMTGVVIVMVIIVAFIIWAMDSLLLWLVKMFTGQGG